MLEEIGIEIIEGIRENLQKYNRNASGNASKSLRQETTETETTKTLKVFGSSYIYNLEYGRGPTVGKIPEKFTVQSIESWIVVKGLSYDIPLKSLAYLIWRKINKIGYKGTPGVITDTVNPNNVNKYMQRIAQSEVTKLVTNLKYAINSK